MDAPIRKMDAPFTSCQRVHRIARPTSYPNRMAMAKGKARILVVDDQEPFVEHGKVQLGALSKLRRRRCDSQLFVGMAEAFLQTSTMARSCRLATWSVQQQISLSCVAV